jgi:hypothetical protein
MDSAAIAGAVVWLAAIVLLVIAVRRTRKQRRGGGVGSGAAGIVYDLLNEDKRKAVEIIVEHRAEAQDPEDRDGNLPDLADPGHSRPNNAKSRP